MKKVIAIIAMVYASTAHAGMFGDEISVDGFNGVKWGTPISDVAGKQGKNQKYGMIKIKKTWTTGFNKGDSSILGVKRYDIVYKFCEGRGLCAGVIALYTGVDNSVYMPKDLFEWAMATVASKYGGWGSKTRSMGGQWQTEAGKIIVEHVIKKGKPFILIIYRSAQYYKTLNHYEKKAGENGMKQAGNFKF